MLKMSGRIYNAMMKFAKGINTTPQLADMFFDHGKIYATDSYAMCRWTPADEYEVIDNKTGEKIETFFFAPRMDKIPAGTTIFIDDTTLDIDRDFKTPKEPDKIMESEYSHLLDVGMGVNPDYLAAIATLGKAIKADKCGADGTISIDWAQKILHAHIDAGTNGYFDVVVMPRIDKAKN